MFGSVGVSLKATMVGVMHSDIERWYARVITRFAHKPNATGERHKLPLMFVSADLPVPKDAKISLADVCVNDGLHCHAIFLKPPVSRFNGDFHRWAAENEKYLIADTRIARQWIGPVFETPAYMTQYALKAVGTRLSSDAVLILPRERRVYSNPTDKGYDEACRAARGASMIRTGWKPL